MNSTAEAINTDDTGPVVLELVRADVLARHYCDVCGGNTHKVRTLCEVRAGPYRGFRVCETCLRVGSITERLEEHAQELERSVGELRALAGRLVVPTFEEWERAEERASREGEPAPATLCAK
jgi:hypothetical protein